METLQHILLVIRSAIYLWVGIESLFLHSLYNYGYQRFKPTPIIKSLHKFFLCLGMFFISVSFIPILNHFTVGDVISGDFFVRNLAAFIALFVGFYLTKFRTESLREIPQRNPLNKKEGKK